MGKRCRTCKYRAAVSAVNGCDYIELEGHSRGCDVENCDKYARGKRMKRRTRLDEKFGGVG